MRDNSMNPVAACVALLDLLNAWSCTLEPGNSALALLPDQCCAILLKVVKLRLLVAHPIRL